MISTQVKTSKVVQPQGSTVHCPHCDGELDIQALIQHESNEAIQQQLQAQQQAFEQQLKQQLAEEKKRQAEQLKQREDALRTQLLEEQAQATEALNSELKAKSEQLKELHTLRAQKLKIQREKEELLSQAEAEKESLRLKLRADLAKEQERVLEQREAQLKAQLLEEQAQATEALNSELKAKSEQIKELHTLRAEKLKIQREKDELASQITAEKEAQFQQQLVEERQKIKRLESERYELQVVELKKQLEDQRQMTEEMKRRQEQGSMQLQGEAQELAMEQWLREHFRFDEVAEVKKGDMGADCLHRIRSATGQDCGVIYYESKRTKSFQESWIPKFKKDMMAHNVDLGVLVTAVYPKGMERMGLRDGIYICNYDEFKSLCHVLRQQVIALHQANQAQENRGEKTVMLYHYLTGNEFKLQFEAIVNGFVQMRQDLEAEKRAFNTQWKKREKQLDGVLLSTSAMYGSIKGIAGNAAPQVEALELMDTNDTVYLLN
ncbi:MAG: DUF2130 domain-containing protein [Vampirovibrionales bacterium]